MEAKSEVEVALVVLDDISIERSRGGVCGGQVRDDTVGSGDAELVAVGDVPFVLEIRVEKNEVEVALVALRMLRAEAQSSGV